MIILSRRTGEKYTHSDWNNEKHFENIVDEAFKRNGVYLDTEIVKVLIGSSDYPTNEIHMSDGMILFDETTCRVWTSKKNDDTIKDKK